MIRAYRKRNIRLIVGILCFMAITVHAAWSFEKDIVAAGLESKREELKRTAELNAANVKRKYLDRMNALTSLAGKITGLEQMDQKMAADYMKFLAELRYFDYVGISDEKGNALDSAGNHIDISDREYFFKAMEGNVVISDILTSKLNDGGDIQVMGVPIMKNGKARGLVYGILNVETVKESLDNISGNHIFTQLIDSNGNPVTRLKTENWMQKYENVWDYYKECEFINGSEEKLRSDIRELKSGYYTLEFQGEFRVTYYTPLVISGYYIYSNLDFSYLHEILSRVNQCAGRMTMEIAAGFFLLLGGIYLFNRLVSRELRKSYESAISNEEILKIAAKYSENFIFEYDLEKKRLRRKAGNGNILFEEEITENLPQSVLDRKVLSRESEEEFQKAFLQIQNQESVMVTVRSSAEAQGQWFRILMKNLYDEKQQRINTVGVIENVTDVKLQEEMIREEKRGKEEFQNRAERDGLTGLYNSATASEKITQLLKAGKGQGESQLLVLLDLDNFKKINDTFGHYFGNQVLRDIAEILTGKFRHDDIVARMGGDEFAVFLLNTTGFEKMEHIFQGLVKECNRTYEKDGDSVTISASLGIAEAPKQGQTFEELFQKADKALYEVKRKSKNGYQLYQEK